MKHELLAIYNNIEHDVYMEHIKLTIIKKLRLELCPKEEKQPMGNHLQVYN